VILRQPGGGRWSKKYAALRNHHALWILQAFASHKQTGRFHNFSIHFKKLLIMRTEQILSADVLDIIFDNRNKHYGAYNLRKFYGNRLAKALVLTFIMAAGVMLAFNFFKKERAARPDVPEPFFAGHVVEVLPPVELTAPKPKPVPKQSEKLPSQKFVANVAITKDENKADKLAKDLNTVAIAGVTQIGKPDEPSVVKGPEPGDAKGSTIIPAVKTIDRTTPMASPEVMPSFPGGMEALRKFLQKNLQNPQDLDEGQIISVKVKFVVGYDGALKSFEIIEDGGKAFNNEVLRVLKKMPEWVPGKSNGENVSVYYTIPVKFTAAE
jgi:periplasmic protein TonB